MQTHCVVPPERLVNHKKNQWRDYTMSLVRKRKSSSRKGSPAKSFRTGKSEFTGLPESYNASSPLGTEASVINSTSQEKKGLEVHGTASSWRRSPRIKGHGRLGQVPSPEFVATDQSPGEIQGEEQAGQCFSQHSPQREEDTDMDLVITMDDTLCKGKSSRKKGGVKRKKRLAEGAVEDGHEEEVVPEVEIDRELDRELENKSKQHNLTTTNVRNIIHEVITNEHVVAMMKAAINETEAVPVFEPKMTRSKFKEVVEKGAVIPTWNISPIKKVNKEKAQQFVDIQLAEEDSSDEEYRPNEDEEDETAEDTFQESDMESTASSPRGSRLAFPRGFYTEGDDDRSCSPMQAQRSRSRHLRVEAVPMGPPPPPQTSPVSKGSTSRAPPDCSFLEKLHAVEEELAIGPVCLEPYQPPLADGLMACRTRSKRPLRDVPMGQLEAELRAPDITPDMYECGSVSEDPEWTNWLQGIMTSDVDNEEEADDDEDDPEYNFLAEIDEPDLEDYRNDRAVRITKKEVNQLMEELFETFQDELMSQELEEGHEEEEEREEETSIVETPTVNTPPAILETLEDPIAEGIAGRRLTVKEQLAAIRRRRALLVSQGLLPPESLVYKPREPPPPFNPTLSHCQWLQLQQQVQQHVQLLTQVHMLTSPVASLQSEAATTQQFLMELQMFAERGELSRCPLEPGFTSVFRACNLQGALSLVKELRLAPIPYQSPNVPRKNKKYKVRKHPTMPPQLAWLFATRPVFLYPELLPVVSLDPALFTLRFFSIFTDAEDCLAVLGLRNMADTLQPKQLVCQYLLRAKRVSQLVSHVIEKCKPVQPHNVFKAYLHHGVVQPMPLACGRVMPGDLRPPVEREEEVMPDWLRRSLPYIHQAIKNLNMLPDADARSICELNDMALVTPPLSSSSRTPEYSFPAGTRYTPQFPNSLTFQRCGFRRKNPEASCSLSLSLAVSHNTSCSPEEEVARSLNNTQTLAVLQQCMANHKRNPVQPAESTPPPPPTIPLQIILSLPATAVIYPAPTPGELALPSPISTPLAKDLITHQFSLFANLRQMPRQLPTPQPNDVSLSLTNLHTLAPNINGGTASACIETQSSVSTETPIDLSDDQTSRASQWKPNRNMGIEKPPPDSQEPAVLDQPLTPNDYVTITVEEEEVVKEEMEENEHWGREADGEDFGMPALALSESSASPSGSIDPMEWPEEVQEITLSLSPRPSDMGHEQGVEVMSPASEESTLSVPELQDTMKKLSWLVSEGRSEDSGSERSGTPTGCHSCTPTPPSSRQVQHPIGETCSDRTHRSPTVPYDDDNLLDSDPLKEKKQIAFAQNYLNRVCEVLQEVPGRVEEFLKVLYEFKQDTDQRTSVKLFMRLKPVLSEWPELLRDFAAFLHPEQAQECGLLAEQQAFERSRRFLRQLELSFGDDSSHYLKIVRILQEGSDVSPAGIKEMKSQIATLLRGHTHLQGEFWVYFNELHPQPALQCPTKARYCDDVTNTKTISQKSSVEKKTKEFKGPKTKQVVKSPNAQSTISEHPVCAKNISLTPSGERVILWTREADRAILTACKQKGANKSTFQAVSTQLGNKTANEVCVRFQELVHLFHSSTQQVCSEEVSDAEQPTSSRQPDPD
ncbi:hypothetical protein UPYG_G00338090 [Umbra pygmaea]|uniref:GON-4-like protein n=1 Tax=Umbra pygmaea TaxID=75934 RepID=A0ABD0W0R5_UMBPY